MFTTQPSARAYQKQEDLVGVFWERRLSPFFTRAFVRLGITPNQATLLWGALGVANTWFVYRAMTGDYRMVPVVWAMFVLGSVIDCADGEVARATDTVNPMAGKLLDGVCHRATEYALLAAYGGAAWALTGSAWALPLMALLMSGDAMRSYVYERRLSILRVQKQERGRLDRRPAGLYAWGTPWTSLPARQRLATIGGLFHYKSVYPVIALAWVSGQALLAGLLMLAAYKQWAWIRMLAGTLGAGRQPAAPECAESYLKGLSGAGGDG